jgi:transposase InsO family protein
MRLQTELLNRKEWKTRVELSTALFEYLEIFHNRTRRHSSLGMLTRSNMKRSTTRTQTPPDSHKPSPENRGQTKPL